MHLDFEDIFDEIVAGGKLVKNQAAVEEFIECVMDELEELSHPVYEKLTIKLCKMMCDKGFTKELALYAVAGMENADPKHAKGEFWTYREVEDIAKKHGIDLDVLPNFYFAINMMRSDYYNCTLPEDEIDHYAVLAKDWLMDKDIPNSVAKSLNYWYHISKGY